MAESKKVRAYRKALQEGDDGKSAKLALEIEDAESKRPGSGKVRAPGDNAKPGRVEASMADDPRRNRPATKNG